MSVKCGIIGLPNVGKSTIFNIFTKLKVPSLNFPFCTIKPNVGFASVYDDRLFKLKEIVCPDKLISATVKIVDIAGLVKGASKGEGLGNNFLSQIREVDALIHVVRCFYDEKILHVNNKIDPIDDIEIINTELIFSDIEFCEKQLILIKNSKNINKENFLEKKNLLEKCIFNLKNFILLRTVKFSHQEKCLMKEFKFLTFKPTIFLVNFNTFQENKTLLNDLKNFLKKNIIKFIDPKKFKVSFKNKNSELFLFSEIINSIYKILNLETFFTVGKKEIKAWPFIKGSNSVETANIIHSDFGRGFIRAKVINYFDFIKYKSENNVKKAGKLRLEGKNYIVKDGDIIHFLFNV
ncbi:MAG: redox-regulated ATPase YchF [Buchnera aphidicola (Periphyllus lyropictus)]|uniref:redox-regulated ATPase YchF n=1 Tax=Buchnera aphidicola TaxID=9 RepID=UPI001ED38789|nr:redox-regulated ATPase YchF [Buchnera aphidicola]NIH16661.1 redox-regulated ATPase YchF [Buchnera aphidicola (Periphyllus lyropictus)]USS94570.1 redox-regulated ATPase YchF [Buchnera aphidicola (Periphyllus lyropictus)]